MSVASSINVEIPSSTKLGESATDYRTIRFSVDGMRCGACAAAVEKSARSIAGVELANVDLANEKLLVQGLVGKLDVDRILKYIQRAGYQLTLAEDTGASHERARRERRSDLTRIAVAGLLGMQVMMLATSLYFADPVSMDQGLRGMLTWLCMLLTTPIMFYCAMPFLRGALRSIRNLNPGMDVTVSLGLILAYTGSVWNTAIGTGELYFAGGIINRRVSFGIRSPLSICK